MTFTMNDIVGEDSVWYWRPSQYTAVITSLKATLLVIKSDDFKKSFKSYV